MDKFQMIIGGDLRMMFDDSYSKREIAYRLAARSISKEGHSLDSCTNQRQSNEVSTA